MSIRRLWMVHPAPHKRLLPRDAQPARSLRSASLPIVAHREEILAAVRDHRVVLVAGETGCGKTTQVGGIAGHTACE